MIVRAEIHLFDETRSGRIKYMLIQKDHRGVKAIHEGVAFLLEGEIE